MAMLSLWQMCADKFALIYINAFSVFSKLCGDYNSWVSEVSLHFVRKI